MSLASVWLWGGTSGTARKRALTEALLCVIVVLEDGVVGVGMQDRKHRKRGRTGSKDERRSETNQRREVFTSSHCAGAGNLITAIKMIQFDVNSKKNMLFMQLYMLAWAKLMQLTGNVENGVFLAPQSIKNSCEMTNVFLWVK